MKGKCLNCALVLPKASCINADLFNKIPSQLFLLPFSHAAINMQTSCSSHTQTSCSSNMQTSCSSHSTIGRLRLSYASNSRNPRATRVPIEQPRSFEHVTIFDLD